MELTTEQKARVFAMYINQQAKYNDYGDMLSVELRAVDTHTNNCRIFQIGTLSAYRWIPFDDVQLLLRPLSAIADEDAVEVIRIFHAARGFMSRTACAKYLDKVREGGTYERNVECFQYLIQRGYAVPLFIAPGHPLNGKTAIEMEMAIDSTQSIQP